MIGKLQSWLRYFYKVPWCVPAWGQRELVATARCILTGHSVEGPHPALFAAAVKDYLGLPYAVPVNRGRFAIELALRAMGLGKDDDLVMPSYICRSVLEAVDKVGVRPVFADMGPELHVTPETVRAAMTPRTRCVIVAHLFNKVAPVDQIESMLRGSGVRLIDDAAQLFGSRCSGRRVGTFGDCGIVSCGPGKALVGAAGGLLVTGDRELYERAAAVSLGRESGAVVTRRALSFWVWRRLRGYSLPFKVILNRIVPPKVEPPDEACAMSNLDAAIALEQFRSLEQNDANRRRNAEILLRNLGGMAECRLCEDAPECMLLKVVLALPAQGPSVDQVIKMFARAGIECQGGYSPLHQQAGGGYAPLAATEDLWGRVLCIPVEVEHRNPKMLLFVAEEWARG